LSQTARALEIQEPHHLRSIMEVGKEFGLLESELISYGPYKAKISLDALKRLGNRPDGRLVVVSYAVLRRHRVHRLDWLDRPTGLVVRRYEWPHPGDLGHDA